LEIDDYIVVTENTVILAKNIIIAGNDYNSNFLNTFIHKCKAKCKLNLIDSMKNIYISRKNVDITKKDMYKTLICFIII